MDRRCGGMEYQRGVALRVTDPPEGVGFASAVPDEGVGLDAWLEALRATGPWVQPGVTSLEEQLEATRERGVDLVICLGLDRYPPFAIRSAVMRTWPKEVVSGLEAVMGMCGCRSGMVALAQGVPGMRVVRRLAKERGLRRLELASVYPVSDPTLIAWHVATGGRRRLVPGANPVSAGLLMVDAWLCARLGRWLARGVVDDARPVWVADRAEDTKGCVAWLRPGRLDDDLLADRRVVCGDPLSGCELVDRVLPAEAEAVFGVPESIRRRSEEPCVRCGWCAEMCPTHLQPIDLVKDLRAGRSPAEATWCLDCGLCTQVCPSGIDLASVLSSRHETRGREDG